MKNSDVGSYPNFLIKPFTARPAPILRPLKRTWLHIYFPEREREREREKETETEKETYRETEREEKISINLLLFL